MSAVIRDFVVWFKSKLRSKAAQREFDSLLKLSHSYSVRDSFDCTLESVQAFSSASTYALIRAIDLYQAVSVAVPVVVARRKARQARAAAEQERAAAERRRMAQISASAQSTYAPAAAYCTYDDDENESTTVQ